MDIADLKGSNSIMHVDSMVADLVAPVLVKPVAFPCRLGIFRCRTGNFDQALEPAEERWIFHIEIDQYIVVQPIRRLVADYDSRHFGKLVPGSAVRNEVGRRKRPEKLVEALREPLVRGVDHDSATLPVCFRNQAAGNVELVSRTGVEIDLSHVTGGDFLP